MGVIPTRNTEVLAMKGLHLYHADMSNCSMRVRMVLAEKGLEWTSHLLDLKKKETHTPEYFSINPNGLVPTLVHDGVVVIESDDIIEYLDEMYPQPPLRPSTDAGRAEVHEWLKLATRNHVKAVKTWIYANKMRGALRMTDEAREEYRRLQTNSELLEFHEKASSEEGFSSEDVAAAKNLLAEIYGRMEAALSKGDWLVGDRFGLADITWAPVHFTLLGANFDMVPYPSVCRWYDAVRERECFREGVTKWCPVF